MAEGEHASAMASLVRGTMARDIPSAVGAPEFREAMSLLSAAVNVVTTSGPAGRTGFTATAVCSVSDEPAALLFCVNSRSSCLPILRENGVACVNTPRAHETDIADMFAGRSKVFGSERFALGGWTTSLNGCPSLENALIVFECRIMDVKEVSTHMVIFGAVTAVRLGSPGPALVYQNRAYKAV